MSTLTTETIVILQENLDKQVRDRSWRKILHLLAVTGIANNQQLIQASGLNRDKLRRTLDKMTAAAAGFPPLFSIYNRKLRRASERGAAPRVYRIEESGAALCKADGLANAHPCKLEEQRSVLHAQGMLDVHLAAQAAGLEVRTDQNLDYNEDAFIRPDNLVRLPNGRLAIFESEQDARSDYLNRMLRSLAHKAAFFDSQASEACSSSVRMLIDLPRGKLWQRTLTTWQHAVAINREARSSALPFRLLAMPLGDFLPRPDWSDEPETGRWVDLTEAQTTLALPPAPSQQTQASLPFTNLERRMILAALLQELRANGPAARQPLPDAEFLYLMRLIYIASHDPFAPALQRSGTPYESLYLLSQYLQMNPNLRQLIEQTTQKDARRIHWNQSTALHRMQVVVDAFLEYHGWQSDGALIVYTYTPDYQAHGPRRLSVMVEIADPEILMSGESALVPGKQEITILEKSLGWVLTALFALTHHLGLKKPPFW
ncbi:MAG TPA: hypothetical protein PKM01_04405 [Anaerolineaceae bacterium]|nr:hypothetical protein [Anaerolineaceae bacterium]